MADQALVIAWLNDAYSMEQSITQVLENHAKDAKDVPDAQARIEQHLEATRRHAELVKGLLDEFGETPSTTRSAMSTVMGKVQGMSTGLAKDELSDRGTRRPPRARHPSRPDRSASDGLGSRLSRLGCADDRGRLVAHAARYAAGAGHADQAWSSIETRQSARTGVTRVGRLN
ncbi:MAG TPA: DUF892 family protein [Thermomicrobiales bacterium]|nr:DUF892 family protein [Thermomicrobiales bacterium]